MTLTQLSNIFNAIVQQSPGINMYHFGFPQDVNFDVRNNYGNPPCEPYPKLLFVPPNGSYTPKGNNMSYKVDLYFLDRQDGNKNGATCETLLEKMSKLQYIAIGFLKTLEHMQTENPCLVSGFSSSIANFDHDAYMFHDKLVAFKVIIQINVKPDYECVPDFRLDVVNDTDNERI